MPQSPSSLVRRAFWGGFAPDPIQTVSEWADAHRVLSQKSSAEPGRYRTSRTPYVREIQDLLSTCSPVREVTWMAGAQIGKTETMNNWAGYIIDYAPAPTLLVQPTVDMAKRLSKQRLDPMIAESPRLKDKVADSRSRDSGSTMLSKDFPGGIMILTGANSAVGLRSTPIKNLGLDEVDGYPGDVDGEGDPSDLAIARTRTFARCKIFRTSTPTLAGKSAIATAYENGTAEVYMVPCPFCEVPFRIMWANIVCEVDGDAKTAKCVCHSCGAFIDEWHKKKMLAAGEWVATNLDADGSHRSFHLSSLYSPLGWYSWVDAMEGFFKAKSNPDKLRVWVNTVLGEVWTEKGEVPDWKKLYNRREEYTGVPRGGVFLTCGVDIQKERVEYEVVAWGPNHESWSVEYGAIAGETSEEEVWKKLDELLARTWLHESGAEMSLRMMAVDSGYRTQHVYNWTRKYPDSRVIATKGRDTAQQIIAPPKQVDVNFKGAKISRGASVSIVGTNISKSELYGWLNADQPTNPDEDGYPLGYCHFPECHDEEYFKMMCAEQLVYRVHKGYRKYEWEKHRDRNESLDCRILARVVASIVGLDRWKEKDWERAKGMMSVNPSEAAVAPKKKKPRNAGYLGRWQGNR